MRIMKNSLIWCSALCATVIFSTSSQAHAFGLSAVGSFNATTVSTDPANSNLSGGTGVGYGGLAQYNLIPAFDLEVGVLSTPVKFSQKVPGSADIETSSHYLQIPVMVRFTLLPIISAGAGLYYAFPLAKVKTIGPTGTVETDAKADMGATLSIALRFPLAPTLGIVVDGRYYFGWKDVSTAAGVSAKNQSTQILAGLNFSL